MNSLKEIKNIVCEPIQLWDYVKNLNWNRIPLLFFLIGWIVFEILVVFDRKFKFCSFLYLIFNLIFYMLLIWSYWQSPIYYRTNRKMVVSYSKGNSFRLKLTWQYGQFPVDYGSLRVSKAIDVSFNSHIWVTSTTFKRF